MVDVIVPSPGESISEVRLGTWKRGDGDWVEKDELLNEIESDKATLELLAPVSGLLKIKADSGSDQKVKAIVAAIDEKAAKPAGAAKAAPAPATAAAVAASDAPSAKAAATATRATPVARKLAADKGVDLASVPGSGPAGRVMRADVEAATSAPEPARAAAAPARPAPPSPMPVGGRGMRREKMTKLRMRIAERLVESQQTTATLTTFNEVDMSAVMALRDKYKDKFKEQKGVNLGFMSFFTKAVTEALRLYPNVGGQISGEEIITFDYADIGIAVSSPKGLMVPVVRNAERMTLAEIEAKIKELAIKARDGKLSIDEMTGGTFTITNGGVFGSMLSTPILNPPQSAILGMHNIVERPVAVNGQVVIRPIMYVALSYDHRIIDGKESVSFLYKVKEMIEDPNKLVFGGKDPGEVLLGL